MRLTFVLHVLFVLGVVSVLAGLSSLVSTALRRWPIARRLAFGSIGSGFAAVLLSCLSLVRLAAIGPRAVDASSKATILAAMISELMNCTALAVPGTLLGAIALGVVTWRARRAGTGPR